MLSFDVSELKNIFEIFLLKSSHVKCYKEKTLRSKKAHVGVFNKEVKKRPLEG